MSHVMDLPHTLAEIEQFKRTIDEHFTCFDPADVDEFALHTHGPGRRCRRAARRSRWTAPRARSR